MLGDWLQLIWATLTPADTGPFSQGLCAHVPLRRIGDRFCPATAHSGQFYINAFNVDRGKMTIWDRRKSPRALPRRAGVSAHLSALPGRRSGLHRGAAIDTIQFPRSGCGEAVPRAKIGQDAAQDLSLSWPGVQAGPARGCRYPVVFDILGSERLIQEPRNLYDAWVKSIITPLVAIARDDVKLF